MSVSPRAVRRFLIGGLAFWALANGQPAPGNADRHARLSYEVLEGRNLNSFLREGPVAAHLVLRSGLDPRILVAFPAGDSGVGLWFAHADAPVSWRLLERPRSIVARDGSGRPLYGIAAKVAVSGAVDLAIKQAVLSSVRVLRQYQAEATIPAGIDAQLSVRGATVSWARNRLDSAAGYRLSLHVTRGELRDGHIKAAPEEGGVELEIVALSGEPPLAPLSEDELLNLHARPDRDLRHTLTFLSYREKLLAGSWRFDTYFGRDTLMSLELLRPALTPAAIEAGLDSVLMRLSADGEVAHEEDIGERAILDHLQADGSRSDAPVYNYNMIDGTFMLAPVVRGWLLEDARGRSLAKAFLARHDGRGSTPAGADLVTNLRLVIQRAIPFGRDPVPQNLIGLKPGLAAGQWRDSDDGLGGGRDPYDVNTALVPAALEAAAALYGSGLLDPYVRASDRALFSEAGTLARQWSRKARPFFEVTEPNDTARRAIETYATELGVADQGALASVGRAPVRFHALALTANGTPVPVVHSDEGFALLWGNPQPEEVDEAVRSIMRPFPAGLLTDAGVLVANPVFASRQMQERFTRRAYHGTVVWSWQQALLAEALERQLRRTDLPEGIRDEVREAQKRLWQVITAGEAVRDSELWSWTYAAGRFHIAPFGANNSDADESNAAQLWSTVYLAIRPPATSVSLLERRTGPQPARFRRPAPEYLKRVLHVTVAPGSE